jgi:hypothetical protein
MKRFLVVAFGLVLVLIFTGSSFAGSYVSSSFPADNLIIGAFPKQFGPKGNMAMIGKHRDKDNEWLVFIKGDNLRGGIQSFRLIRLDTNCWILDTSTYGLRILEE